MTVIGMGNPDMGDDGIGVRVAELVRAQAAPRRLAPDASRSSAPAEDAVLAGACVAEGTDVLLVDAVDMESEPGTWRVFSAQDAVPGLRSRGMLDSHACPWRR